MSEHHRHVSVKSRVGDRGGGRGRGGNSKYSLDRRNQGNGRNQYEQLDEDGGRHRPGVKDRTRPNKKSV